MKIMLEFTDCAGRREAVDVALIEHVVDVSEVKTYANSAEGEELMAPEGANTVIETPNTAFFARDEYAAIRDALARTGFEFFMATVKP